MKMYEREASPREERKRLRERGAESERARKREEGGSFYCAVTKTYLARGLKGGESSRDCGTLSYIT